MRPLFIALALALVCASGVMATPLSALTYSGVCDGTVLSLSPAVSADCVGQYSGNTPLAWDGSREVTRWNAGDTTSTSLFDVTVNASGNGGTFTYLGSAPLAFFAIKYGGGKSFFEVWDVVPDSGGPITFQWTNPTWVNPSGKTIYAGTSHLSFYDNPTPPNVVPEPSSMSLLGVGLLVLGNRIRRWSAK